MIGRAATAQDDIVGDGTTSNVLFIGELMRQAERYLGEGVHPRILVDGIELAKKETLAFLEKNKIAHPDVSKELLVEVARASLMTKVHPSIANPLTDIIVEAVNTIRRED
jgi:T-complex protein 1 subunit zeta